MTKRTYLTVTVGAVAMIATAGVLGVGAAVGRPAIAGAQPAPAIPADPSAPVPPAATIEDALTQAGHPGVGPGGNLDTAANGTAADLFGLLGQSQVPAPPGAAAGALPSANPLNNGYLLGQNVVPSAPGHGQVVGVAPGAENADTSGIDYVQRLYASYQAGGLTGALLGQRSQDQLGDPLPGTAPPPGTPIPPGLGQNLPDQPPIAAPPPPPAR